jgi:ribosome-associated protein
MADIQLTSATSVPERALTFRFVRSSGPGGQNVNKVATAAELRFDLAQAQLPSALRARLERLAGRRLVSSGEIVIFAQRYRTQAANRDDALARLAQLIARAEVAPKRRIPTRPSLASKQRRQETKATRGDLKRLRSKPGAED